MKVIPSLLSLATLLCIAGCNVGPDYKTPTIPMPPGYSSNLPATQPTAPVDLARWWQSLGDPELDSLVQRAVAANLDLQIALAHLQEARTQEIVIRGGSLPEADITGAVARGTGTDSVKGRIGAPLNAASNTTGLKEITDIVGVDAGWDLDLFGRYRRQLEAARADTQATLEERNVVLLVVISDVARAYMDTRALQWRLAILQDNLRIEQQSLDVEQQAFNHGLTNELNLALTRRELASLQSQTQPLVAEVSASYRALAVLLGKMPGQLDAELAQARSLPRLPERIETGLPVDLLRRRPDILQAERELAASTARIGVATADLFPRVGITAGAGVQGQDFGRTPAVSKFIWSAGPTAYWPVLDFGTLDALVDIQDLHTQESLANYKRAIINAVREVDDAIAAYAAQQDRLSNLNSALKAAQRAVDLASDRFARGMTDYLNVIDAERELYVIEDQYAVAQEAVIFQFITLYNGLGGGWETFQSIPPIHKPQPAILAAFQRLAATQPSQ